MMLKRSNKLLLILLTLVTFSSTATFICSQFCGMTGCTGFTSSDCGSCRTNWVTIAGTSCMLSATSNRAIIDSTPDTGGGIAVNNTKSTSTCNATLAATTVVYGDYKATDVLSFSLASIPLPHYALEVIYNVILIDINAGGSASWSVSGGGVKNFYLQLAGGNTVTTPMNTGSQVTSGGFCDTNKNDIAMYMSGTFTHTALNAPVSFVLWNNNNQNNAQWAFKQFIVIALLCYPGCLTCTAALNTTCLSCDILSNMMLSGTTCATYCLLNYGPSSDPTICITCNQYCYNCSMVATNCSACYTTGTNASYLYDDGTYFPKCLLNCPTTYFKNTTAMTCDLCDPECATCLNTSSTCMSCITNLGWLNYTCNAVCPTSYFLTCNGITCANNYSNCTTCNNKCITCTTSSTTCTACTLSGNNTAYLYNSQCLTNCPNGYYAQNYQNTGPNLCLICDVSCTVCSSRPSPCTACTNGYYLFNNVCGATCPTDYFARAGVNKCLSCAVGCVNLTINMYFADAQHSALLIDMDFTLPLDFSTFNYLTFQTITIDSLFYSLNMFSITYTLLNSSSYRITIAPLGYIFLYNATFTLTTQSQPFPLHQAADTTPFMTTVYNTNSSLLWMTRIAPTMTTAQTTVVNSLASINDALSSFTTLPFVQDIKKAGIFVMLMSGAQATSTTILVNHVPSQNMYQAARFWAMFVFFNVPPWQQNNDKFNQSQVLGIPTQEVLKNARVLHDESNVRVPQRILFDISSVRWRFNRTGQSSFFIFDVYIPILLITVCWILLLVSKKCLSTCKRQAFAPRFFPIMHKIHEVTIFYISMATLLQWMYFDSSSLQRWVSFGLCLLCSSYFFAYELYIYYDMLLYPSAEMGSDKYTYYIQKYSSFLKHIRYVQYKATDLWSPRHWFRPYNYHILSYYKKFLMMIALPLFYDIPHCQIIVLVLIQLMEIVRFTVMRPFLARWRNVTRFLLEVCLFLFFLSVAAQSWLVQDIVQNGPTVHDTVTQYFFIGWIAFALVFLFNGGFVVILIIDVVVGCKYTNQQLMDEARRKYYFNKLTQYEEGASAPLEVLNKYVKLGNLNKRTKELPTIDIRIQYFNLVQDKEVFQIQAKKVVNMFMNVEFNFQGENNISVEGTIDKSIRLKRELSPRIYELVGKIFLEYGRGRNIQNITIKTFLKVKQKQYEAGDKIAMKVEDMFQRVQIVLQNGEKQINTLQKLLPGFPLNGTDLNDL